MSLSNYEVGAVLATADIDRREGLLREQAEAGDPLRQHSRAAPSATRERDGTGFSVYLSPDHAGKATATMAGWAVDDLESVVDELISNGVTFEQYGEDDGPGSTDEKGIIEFDGGKVAFFRDPDGNTHALNQFD